MPEHESLERELAAKQQQQKHTQEETEREQREQAFLSAGKKVQDLEGQKARFQALQQEIESAGDLRAEVKGVRESRKPLASILEKYQDLLAQEGIGSVRDLTASEYHSRKAEVANYTGKKAALHERIGHLKEVKKKAAGELRTEPAESSEREEHTPSLEELRQQISERVVQIDQEIAQVLEDNKPLREGKIKNLHGHEMNALGSLEWSNGRMTYADPVNKVDALQTVRPEDVAAASQLGEAGSLAYQADLKAQYAGAIEQGFQKHLEQKGLAQIKQEMGRLDELEKEYAEIDKMVQKIEQLQRDVQNAMYQATSEQPPQGHRDRLGEAEHYAERVLKDAKTYTDIWFRGGSLDNYKHFRKVVSMGSPFKYREGGWGVPDLINPALIRRTLEKVEKVLTTALEQAKAGKRLGEQEISNLTRNEYGEPELEQHVKFSDAIQQRIGRDSFYMAKDQLDQEIKREHEPYVKAATLADVKVESDWVSQERQVFAWEHASVLQEEKDIEKKRVRGRAIDKMTYDDIRDWRRYAYKDDDTIEITGDSVSYPGLTEELHRLQGELQPVEAEYTAKQQELEHMKKNPPKLFGKEKHLDKVHIMQEEVTQLQYKVGGIMDKIQRLENRQKYLQEGVGKLAQQSEVRGTLPARMTIEEFFKHIRSITHQLENAQPAAGVADDYARYQTLKSQESAEKNKYMKARDKATGRY